MYEFNKSQVVNEAMEIYNDWGITMESAMDIALADKILDQKYDAADDDYFDDSYDY